MQTTATAPPEVTFNHQADSLLVDTIRGVRMAFSQHILIPEHDTIDLMVSERDRNLLNQLKNSYIYNYPSGVVLSASEFPIPPVLDGARVLSLDHFWYLFKLALVPRITREAIQEENANLLTYHEAQLSQCQTQWLVGHRLSLFLGWRRQREFELTPEVFKRCSELAMPLIFLHKFGVVLRSEAPLQATGDAYLVPDLPVPWGSKIQGILTRDNLNMDLSSRMDNVSGRYMIEVRDHLAKGDPLHTFMDGAYLDLWRDRPRAPTGTICSTLTTNKNNIQPRGAVGAEALDSIIRLEFGVPAAGEARQGEQFNRILPLIDVSGSMYPRMGEVQLMWNEILGVHRSRFPGEPLVGYTFSNVATLVQDQATLLCGGSTFYLAAFEAAANHLEANPGKQYCLVFITDGFPSEGEELGKSIPVTFHRLLSRPNVSEATIYGIRCPQGGVGLELLNSLGDHPKATFSEVVAGRIAESITGFTTTSAMPTHSGCVVTVEAPSAPALPEGTLVLNPVTNLPQPFPLRVELGNVVAPALRYIPITLVLPSGGNPPVLSAGPCPLYRYSLEWSSQGHPGQEEQGLTLLVTQGVAGTPDQTFHSFKSRSQILALLDKLSGSPDSPMVPSWKASLEDILTVIGGSAMIPLLRECWSSRETLKDLNALVTNAGRRQQPMSRQRGGPGSSPNSNSNPFDRFVGEFERFYQQLFPAR